MAEKRRNKGAAATVTRLWKTMGRQRIRLVIVAVSVIFYTVLSVAAPVYSAGIVDLLWREIRGALENGTGFRVTWEHGGREIMILLGIYTATGVLYTFQSFLMASFAERLSLELRTQISRKLDRLPLSFLYLFPVRGRGGRFGSIGTVPGAGVRPHPPVSRGGKRVWAGRLRAPVPP